MDTKSYREAEKLMDAMGFDDEERKLVLSDDYFVRKLIVDPDYYNKKHFRNILNNLSDL